MLVSDMARMQSFNLNTFKKTINNNVMITNQKSAASAMTQDSYASTARVMSFEDFSELMNSDRTLAEKHAALVEAYGKDVLSYCAFETSAKAVKNGSFNLFEFHAEMERRAESLRMSPKGAKQFSGFAPGPGDEEVERSKALGAIVTKIQNKMLAGQQISIKEKNFLKEHFPEYYAKALQIEAEVEQLKARLKGAKSEEEAARIYMETKANLMGATKGDKGVLLMMPAIDEAYRSSMKKGSSKGMGMTDYGTYTTDMNDANVGEEKMFALASELAAMA